MPMGGGHSNLQCVHMYNHRKVKKKSRSFFFFFFENGQETLLGVTCFHKRVAFQI